MNSLISLSDDNGLEALVNVQKIDAVVKWKNKYPYYNIFEAWSISYPTKEHPAIWVLCIGAMYNCESKSKPLHLIGFMEMDGNKFAFTYGDEITAEKVFKRIEAHYTGERK